MRRTYRLNELRHLLPAADWWGWRIVWSVALFIMAVTTVVVLVVAFVIGPNPWRDGDAYLDAALRLREGLPLYPELADTHGPTVYRYAPWFAFAWIPLSYLPREVVIPLWQLLMLGCSAIAIIPAWRAGPLGRVVCVVMAPLLLFASLVGNVQPAIVALLAHTIRTGGGPVAVAFAASLKLAPALYAVTYLGRRQWTRAAITVALTMLLWVPALLLGVDHYPAEIGDVAGLWAISPFVWIVVAAALLGASYLAASSPYAWKVSSLLVALAPPRFISYDWTYLLAGFAPRDERLPASAPDGDTRQGHESHS